MSINSESVEIKNILQHHSDLLIQVTKDVNYLRGALDQMNERFGSLEARMNSLETRVNTVEDRVETLNNRMSEAESRLSKEIREVESRLSKEIREVFKWTIGMMVPVWIGILVAIIAQFVKG